MSEHSILFIGPKRKSSFVPSDYTLGQRLYADGSPRILCDNAEMQRGFDAASAADADADTAAYLGRGVERIEDDYQWISRGC